MYSRVFLSSMSRVLALACLVSIPSVLVAQDAPKPAPKASQTDSPYKWDISLGYSYFAPKGTVNTPVPPSGAIVVNSYDNVPVAEVGGYSYFFNRYVGVQAEVANYEWGIESSPATIQTGTHGDNDGFFSVSGGLVARYPTGNFTPWGHVLGGGVLIDGPTHNPFTWGPVITAGGGLDYLTPWWKHRISVRLFQVDYAYMHADFGSGNYGGIASINATRVGAGLVFHPTVLINQTPITLACAASPTSVFPGDPVSVTATAGGLDPKLNAVYSFSGSGITANGATASVATAALAPGVQTVNCGVKEGKPGKEGLKPWQAASSTASYTVKAYEPPTISCSASPASIKPGENSTITATGISPQNRPLTYSYSASAGTVSGTGTTAEFNSTGAPTGTAAITCSVSDDKGQTASGSTSVTITAPYVAPAPHTQALCSITFGTDKKRPARVDNEAKACLDEVALDLQKQTDATAVVVGNSTAAEKTLPKHAGKHAKLEDLAGERAVNTKAYLVTEKGIDASRISVATGSQDAKTVEDYLVPSGATFSADVASTTPVNETVVKPQARKPLAERHPAKKHAAKAAK